MTRPSWRVALLGLLVAIPFTGATNYAAEGVPKDGMVYLTRGSGEAVFLPDVRIRWWKEADLKRLDEAARKAFEIIRSLLDEKSKAFGNLQQLATNLSKEAELRRDASLKTYQAAQSAAQELEKLHRERLQEIINLEHRLEKKQAEFSANPITADQRFVDAEFSTPELDARFADEIERISSEALRIDRRVKDRLLLNADRRKWLEFVPERTVAEDLSGQYRFSFPLRERKVYFVYLGTGFSANMGVHEKIRALLTQYLDERTQLRSEWTAARPAREERWRAEQEVLRRELATKERERVQVLESLRPPAELREIREQLAVLRKAVGEAQTDFQYHDIRLRELRGDPRFSSKIKNLALRDPIIARQMELIAATNEQIEEAAVADCIKRELLNFELSGSEVSSDGHGKFSLPSDVGLVIAHYTNSVIAAGRSFSWVVGVKPNESGVRLSGSNTQEDFANSIEALERFYVEFRVRAQIAVLKS